MGRGLLVTAVCALLIAIGYGLGALAESFSLNECYASSLRTLAARADRTAMSKSDAAIARFRDLVQSLPLAGPRTNCKRVELAVEIPDPLAAAGPQP